MKNTNSTCWIPPQGCLFVFSGSNHNLNIEMQTYPTTYWYSRVGGQPDSVPSIPRSFHQNIVTSGFLSSLFFRSEVLIVRHLLDSSTIPTQFRLPSGSHVTAIIFVNVKLDVVLPARFYGIVPAVEHFHGRLADGSVPPLRPASSQFSQFQPHILNFREGDEEE